MVNVIRYSNDSYGPVGHLQTLTEKTQEKLGVQIISKWITMILSLILNLILTLTLTLVRCRLHNWIWLCYLK